MDTLKKIEQWHRLARPEPTLEQATVQLGCHVEEFLEMIDALNINDNEHGIFIDHVKDAIEVLSKNLKDGTYTIESIKRVDLLDSIADQIVTGIGVAHTLGMQGLEACERVNDSNWSKFNEDGLPDFEENGKIKKGPHYEKPFLDDLIGG